MGHSHRRVDQPVGPASRYLNLGAWEGPDGALPHLQVAGKTIELCWFTDQRPARAAREEAPSARPLPSLPASGDELLTAP